MTTTLAADSRQCGHLPYLLFTPRRGAPENERRPLVVFLHGSGERGDSTSTLGALTRHSLPRLARVGGLPPMVGERPFDFLIACPQTDQKSWRDEVPALANLVGHLVTSDGADAARCYVTGISMGALGCWHAACAPGRPFAALVPVSWGLPPVARSVRLPAWVIIGAQDHPKAQPQQVQSELYADRPRDEQTKLSVDPRGRHNGSFWNRVYADPAIYAWLLRHRRADR